MPQASGRRRPPPYHALLPATRRNRRQRFRLTWPVSGRLISHCLRPVATTGLHKGSIRSCLLWRRRRENTRSRSTRATFSSWPCAPLFDRLHLHELVREARVRSRVAESELQRRGTPVARAHSTALINLGSENQCHPAACSRHSRPIVRSSDGYTNARRNGRIAAMYALPNRPFGFTSTAICAWWLQRAHPFADAGTGFGPAEQLPSFQRTARSARKTERALSPSLANHCTGRAPLVSAVPRRARPRNPW